MPLEKDDKTKTGDNQDTDIFTEIDPSTLSDELQGIYKSLQADYTRKTQDLGDQRKTFDTKVGDWEKDNAQKFERLGSLESENQQWRAWSASLKTDEGGDATDKTSSTGVDYEGEPGEAKYEALNKQYGELVNRMESLEKTTSRSNEEVGRMFKYQDSLNELKVNNPTMDKEKVIEHMLAEGITDPSRAYKEVYQDDIVEQKVQEKFDRMEAEFKEKQKADFLTGPGASIESKVWRPSDKPRSWEDTHDDVVRAHRETELGTG